MQETKTTNGKPEISLGNKSKTAEDIWQQSMQDPWFVRTAVERDQPVQVRGNRSDELFPSRPD